jgi:class 3 adenylate cyclase
MARRLAWAAFLAIVLAYGLTLTAVVAGASDWTLDAFLLLLWVFPAVGILILTRQPANTIGWILLAVGGIAAAGGILNGYASYGLRGRPGSLPGADVALALSQPLWAPVIGIIGTYLLLLFPDGRLPSRRARVVIWSSTVGIVGTWALLTVVPSTFDEAGYPGVANPLRIEALRSFEWVGFLFIALIPISIVASAATVVLRFRRSRGTARLQLKWLTAAAALAAILYALAFLAPGDNVFKGLGVLSFLLIPIAIGFAILRYRLYDIDVLINRTVVYGTVTAVLAVAFGLGNLAAQRLLEAMTAQRSDLLTVAFIGGAAFAFGPLRARIRPIVDRFLPARALVTLLFTDIVGSTRMAVELGDEGWRALLGRYRVAVRRELARFGGHEVDAAGDGFFVTFQRPAPGLMCASAIRAEVEKLGLRTRTGLHMGECEMRGEKVSGLAVHIAARVMAAAADGEVLVTEAVREASTAVDAQVAARGRHQLKGVPGEWQLFALSSAPTGR